MKRLVVALLLVNSLSGAAWSAAETSSRSETKSDAAQIASEASRRAIFAVFLANQGSIDTAISISNIMSAPPGLKEVFEEIHPRTSIGYEGGTLEFYLWDDRGVLHFYETAPDSPGIGLSPDGTLQQGQTYRVLLSEILIAAKSPRQGDFAGYGWIVANFGGVQGTAMVTDFSGFQQTIVMQPDIGSTFFDFDASAGIPLEKPRY